VKTQFGYHIIKLDGIQPATSRPSSRARSDVEVEYRRNEAERLFNNLQDKLADAALQNGTDIDVVARKAGLPVQTVPASAAPRAAARWANRPRSSRRHSARTCSTAT
jgi:peptidyl-prolyl cis-trans isomerase D